MGERAKKVDREKGGQDRDVRYSFSLSHIGLSPVPSSMPGMIRERERTEREEGKKKRSK